MTNTALSLPTTSSPRKSHMSTHIPHPNGHETGLILAFQHLSDHPSTLQRFIALATKGEHIHVEALPAFRISNTRAGKHYYTTNYAYSAFMGASFNRCLRFPLFYQTGCWDLVFVPMSTEQLARALGWADRALGAAYDYPDAFSCPIRCMHASKPNFDPLPRAPPRELFCSEAVLYMLFAAGVRERAPDLARIIPEHCSPAALYREITRPEAAGLEITQLNPHSQNSVVQSCHATLSTKDGLINACTVGENRLCWKVGKIRTFEGIDMHQPPQAPCVI